MPLPADLVTVEVTATYEAIDGTLASGGTVTFDAGGIITDNAGLAVIGEPATVPVVNGQIAVSLPATDNQTLNPVGFQYTVTEQITGWAPRTYQLKLPSSYAPSIDLSQIAPATAPSSPPDPDQQATGDLSGPWASPVVTHTHLAEPLPPGQGGTGQATPLTWTDVGADQAGAAAGALTQAQQYTDAETAQLASQISAVSGLKVTPGASPPPGPDAGDLWIDTSAGNTLEQWDGTAWTPYQFGLAALAPDVTSQLGSGSAVTMGPAIPSSARAGDLWIQTDAATGVITAILQCTTGYDSGGTRAANWGVESAATARALGAPYTYQQSATPSTANNASNPPQLNDLWINTGAGNTLEQMTGGTPASPSWTPFQIGLAALGSDAVAAISAKAKASLGPSVPASANTGDLWIRTDSAGASITGIFTCVTAYTSGGTTANWSTETLSARALGAPFAYQQAAAPSASANPSNPPQTGDLWINTSAGNVIEQMTGGTASAPVWTQFQLGSAALASGAVGTSQLQSGAVTQAALGTDVTSLINGKAVLNLSSSVPASANAGDAWIQVNSAGNITGIYRCVTAYTSGGTTANWSSQTLTARAIGSPFVYQQSSTPNTANNASNPPQMNDLWVNTGSGNVISQMTGGTAASPAWTAYQFGSAAIANGAVGTGQLATSVTSRALGGVTTTIGTTAPASGNITGDLFINSSTGQVSRWSGTAWTAITINAASVLQAGTIAGNLIAAAVALSSPVITGGTITGAQFIATGSSGEFLGYSGTPAAGNLTASISPAAGTDSHSNSYQEGVAVYGTGGSYTVISLDSSGEPYVAMKPAGTTGITSPPEMYARTVNPGAVNEYTVADFFSGQESGAVGYILSLSSEAKDASSLGGIQLATIAPGGAAQIPYLTMNSQGNYFSLPLSMYDPVAGPPTLETWHNITPANGWTIGTSGYFQYKLKPDNTVAVRANNLIAGTTANATVIGTVPSRYVPANDRVPLNVWANYTTVPSSIPTTYPPELQVRGSASGVGGQIIMYGLNGGTISNITVSGSYPLD